MATTTHGLNTALLLGGYNISQFFKSASIDASKDTVETTAFGSSAKTHIPGLSDATASLEGMFDSSVDGSDVILNQIFTGQTFSHFSYYPEGPALGKFGVGMEVSQTSHAISSSTDDVVQASAEVQANAGMERVQSVQDPVSLPATGDGTSVDGGAATTTGGVAILHVLEAGTSTQVTVQHSTDNLAWVDLFTFPAATAPGSERLTVQGTVNRYLRVKRTLVGGPATVQVGVSRHVPVLP